MPWLKRRMGVCWLAGMGLMLLLGCTGTTDPVQERPPIVMITVDGLVAADLEPFGGSHPMPHLQRLVDSGTAWPTALSAVPMTRPSVATYLTGLAPDRHAVRDDLFAVLPEDVPTLAERLKEAGYRTAGFPDSSFLPERSGLWRGFELVDWPPPVALTIGRWLPRVLPPEQTGNSFSAWLDTVEEGTDWFGWVHLSHPLSGQYRQQYFPADARQGQQEESPLAAESGADEETRVLDVDDVGSYEEALSAFDTALGRILDEVDARPDGDQTLVVVAGNMADQRRDDSPFLPGLGYSLDRRVVEVPIIVRLPKGLTVGRGSDEGVWTPDLAATVAAAAGIELSAEAEGVSLTEPEPARTVFSWSWALLDQMGWRTLTLARNGERELALGDNPDAADDPTLDDLRAALATRANPSRVGLPQEDVAALLAEFEIEPDPLPVDGRDFLDPPTRKMIASQTWIARAKVQANPRQQITQFYGGTKRRQDPRNYVAYLDSGQMMSLRGMSKSVKVIRQAISLRPDDPEAWHWYAHANWTKSWETSERMLVVIEPYLGNHADALYDLACARSLAQDLPASADYLERAYLAGFRNRAHIGSDPDLRNLRESEHYSRVMQRFH